MSDKTKTLIKDLALIIGIPLFLIILVCTYNDGTEYSAADIHNAKEEGRAEGYDEGYEEGYEKGYENGHCDGYIDGYED